MSTAGKTSRASRRGAATTDSAPERIWVWQDPFGESVVWHKLGDPQYTPDAASPYIRQDISDAAVEAERERRLSDFTVLELIEEMKRRDNPPNTGMKKRELTAIAKGDAS